MAELNWSHIEGTISFEYTKKASWNTAKWNFEIC